MNYDLHPPLCRASDPLTSFEAADSARRFKESDKTLIIKTLSYHGPCGVDRIGALCGRPGHAIGKRMKELRELGQVEKTGRDVKSDSGNDQAEWRIV